MRVHTCIKPRSPPTLPLPPPWLNSCLWVSFFFFCRNATWYPPWRSGNPQELGAHRHPCHGEPRCWASRLCRGCCRRAKQLLVLPSLIMLILIIISVAAGNNSKSKSPRIECFLQVVGLQLLQLLGTATVSGFVVVHIKQVTVSCCDVDFVESTCRF